MWGLVTTTTLVYLVFPAKKILRSKAIAPSPSCAAQRPRRACIWHAPVYRCGDNRFGWHNLGARPTDNAKRLDISLEYIEP
jgi:hypothetical protein